MTLWRSQCISSTVQAAARNALHLRPFVKRRGAKEHIRASEMRSCRLLFCRALPQLLIFLCLAAHFDTFITGAHGDDGCSSPHFEYMLSTASVAVQSCFSYDIGISDVLVCPAGTSTGTMLAIASIIACSDLRVDTYTPHRIPCDVAVCACADEDDLDCIDCHEGAASGFPCVAVPLEGANRHSCLRLAAQVPLSSLSRQITTIGQYSHAHDRFIFKTPIPSSSNHDASIISHSTPSLGPWTLGPLHRWRLSHALDDDSLSALDLKYQLTILGDAWPAARCLDGSKGAYYLYEIPPLYNCCCIQQLHPCCLPAPPPPDSNGAYSLKAADGVRVTTTVSFEARYPLQSAARFNPLQLRSVFCALTAFRGRWDQRLACRKKLCIPLAPVRSPQSLVRYLICSRNRLKPVGTVAAHKPKVATSWRPTLS